MVNKKTENEKKYEQKSFLENKKTIIIFTILIILTIILPFITNYHSSAFLNNTTPVTNTSWNFANSIALLAALISALGILYSNNQNNNRINKQLIEQQKNLDKQLLEQQKNLDKQLNWKDTKNALIKINKDIIDIFNKSFAKTFEIDVPIRLELVDHPVVDTIEKRIEIPEELFEYETSNEIYFNLNYTDPLYDESDIGKRVFNYMNNPNLFDICYFIDVSSLDAHLEVYPSPAHPQGDYTYEEVRETREKYESQTLTNYWQKYVFMEEFERYILKNLTNSPNDFINLPETTQNAVNIYINRIRLEKKDMPDPDIKQTYVKYNLEVSPLITNIIKTVIKELNLKNYNEYKILDLLSNF